MIFLLISLLSFLLLLSKSLALRPLFSWATEMRLLSLLFCKESLFLLFGSLRKCRVILRIPFRMCAKRRVVPELVEVEETKEMSVLDLPELTLECILSRLPPEGLCNMAAVCRSLRDRCRSMWELHMKEKWERVIGTAAHREWRSYLASRKDKFGSSFDVMKTLVGMVSCVWPLSWLRTKIGCDGYPRSSLPVDSIMNLYLSLESGQFWFPAQVYNRENGHLGFMLSCYDAELSYDRATDTFRARYPPHGRRTIVVEDRVCWERLRIPPVHTTPHDLHISDCLNDLCPGDHIEIQWRRNKEFPYGWWYGVVGHLETCGGNKLHCRCHKNDTVMLEFNHYTAGSRWRRKSINRKDFREEGNETIGFYGGIRKLSSNEEISAWKKLWPSETLE